MMGIYSCALTASAALAAGTTVPFGKLIGHSWRGALTPWFLFAVVSLLVWIPQLGGRTRDLVVKGPLGPLLRSPVTWAVTAYFGMQSLNFYALAAWLPSYYQDHGYSAASSGLLVSASIVMQVPLALVASNLAARRRTQTRLVVFATSMTAIGLLGVLVAPRGALLWTLLLGTGQGVAFPTASSSSWPVPLTAATHRASRRWRRPPAMSSQRSGSG